VGQFETYCQCCNIALGVVAQLKAESFLQVNHYPKELKEVMNRLMPAMWFRSGSELNHMADTVSHLFFMASYHWQFGWSKRQSPKGRWWTKNQLLILQESSSQTSSLVAIH
jgi:hypothetical protein